MDTVRYCIHPPERIRMTATPPTDSTEPLLLNRFIPFRLSVLSNQVSRAVARIYARRFRLKLPEWRVLAILGVHHELTASQICEITAMDKVAISRAVTRLIAMGRVTSIIDPADARRALLSLTAEGLDIYQRIVPMARAVEARLLEQLTESERALLHDLFDRLGASARELDR